MKKMSDSVNKSKNYVALGDLRKAFNAHMKSCESELADAASTSRSGGHFCEFSTIDAVLQHFDKVMDYVLPEDLFLQFKEYFAFCAHITEHFVAEIKRVGNAEDTSSGAAASLFVFVAPAGAGRFCRGWAMLKAIVFMINSGPMKIAEIVSKKSLPSTVVKIFYIFFDLPDSLQQTDQCANSEEKRWLYDSLVMLMISLCSHACVAEELVQHDDLLFLFNAASAECFSPGQKQWRDAMFTFLCTIFKNSLCPSLVRYIHAKGCIALYTRRIFAHSEILEKTLLLCNAIDLFRSSANCTQTVVEDFIAARGLELIRDCFINGDFKEAEQLMLQLADLMTAGNEAIQIEVPQSHLLRLNYKLSQNIARSTGTIRFPQVLGALLECFNESDSQRSLLILETILALLNRERMNYFVIDQHFPLTFIFESLGRKDLHVKNKAYELLDFVLRELNYIPAKELASLNYQMHTCLETNRNEYLDSILSFFLRFLPLNPTLKDAYRELHVLTNVFEVFKKTVTTFEQSKKRVPAKLCLDALSFLNAAITMNACNSHFIIEHMEFAVVKCAVLLSTTSHHKTTTSYNETEFSDYSSKISSGTLTLVKHLLLQSKSEQMFSSLIQLMFSDPGCIEFCTPILTLTASALAESHKGRIMFRRSGGYICLMTLLLNLDKQFVSENRDESLLKFFRRKGDSLFQYLTLIFNVLMVSMRYEPSNARYFLTEIWSSILQSIMRSFGCFGDYSQIDVKSPVWTKTSFDEVTSKLRVIHSFSLLDNKIFDQLSDCASDKSDASSTFPVELFSSLYVIRLLLNLALDHDRTSSKQLLTWSRDPLWLQSPENIELIPLFSTHPTEAIIVHPTSVLAIIQLLPAMVRLHSAAVSALDEWSAATQFYVILLLRTLLRSERNQQIMCRYEMPRLVLDVGEPLFKQHHFAQKGADPSSGTEHLLMGSFNYIFERLACQSLHPRELRRFLRLGQPLCCRDIDSDEDDEGSEKNAVDEQTNQICGKPVPIHRVKAFVSVLTPRDHALVNPPAFVEFDLSVEGFASLFIPSLASSQTFLSSSAATTTTKDALSSSSSSAEICSCLQNGFTLLLWFCIEESSGGSGLPSDVHSSSSRSSLSSSSHSSCATKGRNAPITLFTMLRNYDDGGADGAGGGGGSGNHRSSSTSGLSFGASIENSSTFFDVSLDVDSNLLLVNFDEFPLLERKQSTAAVDFAKSLSKSGGKLVALPVPMPFMQQKQWNHLTISVSKASGSKQQITVEILINGYSLAIETVQNVTLKSPVSLQSIHALVGTPPFFRRVSNLRWRIASLYLLDEPLPPVNVASIAASGVAYIGNHQALSSSCVRGGEKQAPLVDERKIFLSLNAKSGTEVTLASLHAIARKSDCELVANLLGLSVNDSSTPLRVLSNLQPSSTSEGSAVSNGSFGAALIGYIGVRVFTPSPVGLLLDSIGGLSPIFGLIAMSTDSMGLYASIKALASALLTNASLANSLHSTRGFQTLAILIEEKALFLNSNILNIIFSLVCVYGGRENVVITNLQSFDDLLCDFDVWRGAPEELLPHLFQHFLELILDSVDNLAKVRASSLFPRLLMFLFESFESSSHSVFPVRNEAAFRIIHALIQPPCDETMLMNLVQTISATYDLECVHEESSYPSDDAEIERMLITGFECSRQFDKNLYMIFLRNKLLDIVSSTMAAHSFPFAELLVNKAGFSWLLTLCSPREVHSGTTFLAMKILIQTLKHSKLSEKFRDGTANGGWLSGADSVVQNKAATLLGFSVAAGVGAVGSKVDVNPELSCCSGFAVLEQIAFWNAENHFFYFYMLAILFQSYEAKIKSTDEFTIDLVWSNILHLDESSSVGDAIECVQFFCDAIIPILALLRRCLHHQFLPDEIIAPAHWSCSNALTIVQLLTFLYQNSANFFTICHSETFVLLLFTTLTPFTASHASPPRPIENEGCSNDDEGGLPPNSQREKSDPSALYFDNVSRSRRQIIELLSNCFLNDFCITRRHQQSAEGGALFDPLFEFVLTDTNAINQSATHFTDLIDFCLDQLLTSKIFFVNSVVVPVPQQIRPKLNPSSEEASHNILAFLTRIIDDTVWNCIYRGNPLRILKCLLKILAESHASNKAAVQIPCSAEHVKSMLSVVLYLLSRPIDCVDTQMCILDTLAELLRNQHIFLSTQPHQHSADTESTMFGALAHVIFMLSDRSPVMDHGDELARQLERGSAQVIICAQSVWGILWKNKLPVLKDIFRRDVDLDLYTARIVCGDRASQLWLKYVDSQTNDATCSPNSSTATLQRTATAIQQHIQSRLNRVARSGIQRLSSTTSSSKKASGVGSSRLLSFSATSSSTTGTQQLAATMTTTMLPYCRAKVDADTYCIWTRVHLSLIKEFVRFECEKFHEWHAHMRKWCLIEWHKMELELVRERGLWGPERGSRLDKFELDTTEGSGQCRVRRLLVPNPKFYQQYAYIDQTRAAETGGTEGVGGRHKAAVSRDSQVFHEKMLRKWGQISAADGNNLLGIRSSKNVVVDRTPAVTSSHLENSTTMTTNATDIFPDDHQQQFDDISQIKEVVKRNLNGTTTTINAPKMESSIEDDTEVDGDEEDAEVSAEANDDAEMEAKTSQDAITTSLTQKSDEVGSAAKRSTPIQSSSFGPDNQTLLRLLEQERQGEQLTSMFRCARIHGLDTVEGLIIFGAHNFYVVDGFTLLRTKEKEIRDLDFLPEQYHDPVVPYIAMGSKFRQIRPDRQCIRFSYDEVREVYKRRYLLQPIALEIFSNDGRNYLLAFPRRIRNRVHQKIVSSRSSGSSALIGGGGGSGDFCADDSAIISSLSAELASTGSHLISSLMGGGSSSQPSAAAHQNLGFLTQRWQRGSLSNFEYLMKLNTMAGRSYNDLSQYPVFPWVLRDYDSPRLDLTDPGTFRDLSKPMGAQSSDRLAQFLKRYKEWDDPETPAYMYGTHYSSAMIVLSYLVRIEPFTQQFLKLQGGHFDLADRMFHSIGDGWLSSSRNNVADVKELIPEFFYLPEMLRNDNNFDLGTKQNGVRLGGVLLPRWANGDPHEFIRLHRQALECDYVSEHLHEWIDLIFGYKQSGEQARLANNVFHHLFYEENVNFDSIEDPLKRNAVLGFINNFGQIPTQLFKKAHPQRRIQHPSSSTTNSGSPHQSQPQNANSSPSVTSSAVPVPGLTTPRLFYHSIDALRAAAKPVRELRSAIGQIVITAKNQVVVLEQNRVFLPPAHYLAWGFHDRTVRIGQIGTDRTCCLLETNCVWEVTCMSTPNRETVFMGLSTGAIFVYSLLKTRGSSSATASASVASVSSGGGGVPHASRLTLRRSLTGHEDAITVLESCPAHNIMVSGGRDHLVIVWHLTQHTFVRQLHAHPGPITAACINPANGDIATASNAQLFLWTLNGMPLAVVDTTDDSAVAHHFSSSSNIILCIAFSSMNDWDPQNVVMCGTSDGYVKVYSLEEQSKNARDDVLSSLKASQTSVTASPYDFNKHQTPSSTTAAALKDLMIHAGGGSFAGKHQQSSLSPNAAAPSPFNRRHLRVYRLRRKLGDHTTAFTSHHRQSSGQNNPQQQQHGAAAAVNPAPVTAITVARDHRSLLVGDGIGRVWTWRM